VGESEIERDILVWLNTKGGCFAWKNHTQGTFDQATGQYRKQSPFAIRGVSDIIGIAPNGVVFFIEVKGLKGVQSSAQKLFEKSIVSKKGYYLLARSVGEVDEFISRVKQVCMDK